MQTTKTELTQKPKGVTGANINKYAKEYRLPAILAIILATGGSITTIIGPDKISEITDLITKGLTGDINLAKIGRICLMLIALYAAGAVFHYLHGFIMTTVSHRFSQKLRSKVADKIDKLPLNYFDSHSQGDTLSRVTNDLDTVGQSLNQTLSSLFPSITLLIGCIVMMLKNNVILTATSVGTVLVGFIIVAFILKTSQKYFAAQQKKLAVINGIAEETYTGHNVLTAYSAKNEMSEQFKVVNDDLYDSVWRAQFLSGIMQPMMGFIGNFGYVLVCVVGASLALSGDITFGVIVAFMVYVRLFTQPLGQLAQAFSSFQSANAALGRVFEFIEEDEMKVETDKGQAPKDVKGHVQFNNVRFGYNPDKIIIPDFTAEAKPGKKVAIVGPTGAGKTTIVNLLMKFYELNSGSITIDGVATSDMTRDQVHEQFCMVLQDTWLFEGTIKENLVFNEKGITDEQVYAACKAAGIHRFIRTLPKGYDSMMDDSLSLSVGQKQLLTIARALLKDSPMLILDEATSSVDTRTEELIQKAMDKLMEGRTSFVIAHRLSTIRNADNIFFMQDGNIVEQGNHEELMALGGNYADLYNSQFAK